MKNTEKKKDIIKKQKLRNRNDSKQWNKIKNKIKIIMKNQNH